MRIKKTFQGSLPENTVVNTQSDSQTNAYSCEYINNLLTILNNSLNYSTSEKEIGTWNGNKLYRKCFFYTGYPYFSSNHYKFNHNISNMDRLKDVYGSIWDTVNQQYFPLQFVTTANVNIMLYCNKTQVDIEQSAYGNNRLKDYWVCIEYTKTTN